MKYYSFILIAILILSCSSESSEWEKILEQNSEESYLEFLNKYPDGQFAPAAKDSLVSIDFNNAILANTQKAYEDFLQKYPDSKFSSVLLDSIENKEYESARKENTIEAYSNYIKNYPNGKYIVYANKEIDEITLKKGYFIDKRDNRKYKVVKIGKQVWMAENLAYLPKVCQPEDNCGYWVYDYKGNSVIEAKATNNYKIFGVLYDYETAINSCPAGWHLPTDDEWKALEMYLGMSKNELNNPSYIRGTDEGGKLKAKKTWLGPAGAYNATGESGFSALSGGYLDRYKFEGIYKSTVFLTSTKDDTGCVYLRALNHGDKLIQRTCIDAKTACSVRCIKD